jgi:cysteine synthase B
MSTGSTPIAGLVGRTPLVRLRPFERKTGVEIYAKLESFNPSGSVKDRTALAIILAAEKSGALKPGATLLDATSGNTGFAYAMLAAERGVRVRLCIPANAPEDRKRLLKAYGAELVLTNPLDGIDGAMREARRLHEASPDACFYADQHNNPATWRAHYETTAVELIEQSVSRVTHFVAGLGTTGTFMGTGRRLRAWRPSVKLVAVQPTTARHALEGLRLMDRSVAPGIYDPSLADQHLRVSTEDAQTLAGRLAAAMGLLVGPSSGAALAACLQLAAKLERGVIVTVFPDSGSRYLGEPHWEEPGLHIPGDVEDAIRSHATAAYPRQCCGALLGPDRGTVERVVRLETTAEASPRFIVTAEDRAQAEGRATRGQAVIGFYQSHADRPATPSSADVENVWPDLSYVLVAVRDGRAEELRSWRLKSDRRAFEEERVTRT